MLIWCIGSDMADGQFSAARADKRIKIQSKSVTKNGLGEEVVTWIDAITDAADHCIWAEVWPLKGREFFAAAETQYAADVRFRVRYRANIVREMRVLWADVPYDITQVIDVGAQHWTTEILGVHGLRTGK